MARASRIGRTDLIGHVAGATELTKENAKKVVNAVLEGILTVLEQSGSLRLASFGTFTVKQTKERQGINPKTQQPITIPAGYRMGFKVSQSWRKGMVLRKREQERDKVKVHLAKPAPKAKVATKAKGKKK
jgi:DNA-binding protein HU-beta